MPSSNASNASYIPHPPACLATRQNSLLAEANSLLCSSSDPCGWLSKCVFATSCISSHFSFSCLLVHSSPNRLCKAYSVATCQRSCAIKDQLGMTSKFIARLAFTVKDASEITHAEFFNCGGSGLAIFEVSSNFSSSILPKYQRGPCEQGILFPYLGHR
jgi:hypothetical protein